MNQDTYRRIERHMRALMDDSAHDREHIYRVLHVAMDIAGTFENVDYDVLICACLLHDIGRKDQYENPALCHARVGAEKARRFLLREGFAPEFAEKVSDCIRAHRFRSDAPPESLEAKILFDADKVDVTGALGIARTLMYNAVVSEPLYTRGAGGEVLDGSEDEAPSFLREYRFKLEGLYDKFYTRRASEIAGARKRAAKDFYESLLREARECDQNGAEALREKTKD